MFVESGDIIQVKTVGALQGQQVLNVWHYRITHDGGGSLNLQQVFPLWFIDFDTLVLTHFSENLVYGSVMGINLTNPVQIYEANVTANGDQIGDVLPVHDTISVKLLRTTGITRNGRKAFSGIIESNQIGGIQGLPGPAQDDLEDFCGTDKNYVHPDDPLITVTFSPVIVGRTPDSGGIYQLDLSKVNDVAGAQINDFVKTQNTRKN